MSFKIVLHRMNQNNDSNLEIKSNKDLIKINKQSVNNLKGENCFRNEKYSEDQSIYDVINLVNELLRFVKRKHLEKNFEKKEENKQLKILDILKNKDSINNKETKMERNSIIDEKKSEYERHKLLNEKIYENLSKFNQNQNLHNNPYYPNINTYNKIK